LRFHREPRIRIVVDGKLAAADLFFPGLLVVAALTLKRVLAVGDNRYLVRNYFVFSRTEAIRAVDLHSQLRICFSLLARPMRHVIGRHHSFSRLVCFRVTRPRRTPLVWLVEVSSV